MTRPTLGSLKLTEVDYLAIESEACRRKMATFVRMAWPIIEPQNPYVHGWHVDAICEHLEAITHGDITRLLINIPPGCMKSTLVSVLWPAWEWGPCGLGATRYVAASYDRGLAIRDNRRMRTLVTSEWYRAHWAMTLTSDQNEKTFYENSERGFRQACAVASMTGRRGDRVIWDDPQSVEASFSDVKREVALRVLQETVPTRVNDAERSAIIVVMQRLHEADVSGFILENELGYEHLCLPMEFEPDRRCTTSIGFKDPRTKPDELLFPERFPRKTVERDKKLLGLGAAGQFQQLPAPRGGAMFHTDAIEVVTALPNGLREARGWDLASTEGGGAYTVGFRLGINDDTGDIYMVDVVRDRLGPERAEAMIKQTVVQDGDVPQSLPQDPGQAGKSQAKYLSKSLAGSTFEFTPESGSKIVRANPIASQVNAGNVKMLKAPWNKDVLHELAMFPSGKYRDIIDALSRAYNYLNEANVYTLEHL